MSYKTQSTIKEILRQDSHLAYMRNNNYIGYLKEIGIRLKRWQKQKV